MRFMTLTILFTALLSVAASAYSVDLTTYPLLVRNLEVTGDNNIEFDLQNPSNQNFDLKQLKSFEAIFDETKTISQFVHYSGTPFSVIGTLGPQESMHFDVPFDSTGTTKLRCKQPLEVKLTLENRNTIASWTGIPSCEIEGKRVCGLLKVDNHVAEFLDEDVGLMILWEFLSYDEVSGRVLLMKSVGRQQPVMQWLSVGDCPDVESGSCMTDIIDITFNQDFVSVTLRDNRHDRLATLARSKVHAPVKTIETAPAVQGLVEPEETAQNTVAYQAAQVVGVVSTSSQSPACASGCSKGSQCYDTGARGIYLDNYAYCAGGWQIQKSDGFYCTEDFECRSGSCTGNKCGSIMAVSPSAPQESWITRLLLWIDDLM